MSADALPAIPADLDHIVVGFPNLEDGIARLQQLSGCRTAIGGSHPNRGTRNALLSLGDHCYLELLAPDPAQPTLRWHPEIAGLTELTIVDWAVRHHDLDVLAALLQQRGVSFTGPMLGSRLRPDGQALRWRTLHLTENLQGNLPFFIQWDPSSVHPAVDAPGGCRLQHFQPTGPLPEIPPPHNDMRLHPVPGMQSLWVAKIVGLDKAFQFASIPVPAQHWVPKDPTLP